MKLDDIRREIDLIDDRILQLFIKRLNLTKEIAEIKKESNMPALDPHREKDILKKVAANSPGYESYTEILFQLMMDLSKHQQRCIIDQHEES